MIGFDNAHRVRGQRSQTEPGIGAPGIDAYDHWHRTGKDKGRAYKFTTADVLLADFFAEVRRVLGERGISDEVVGTGTIADRRPQ